MAAVATQTNTHVKNHAVGRYLEEDTAAAFRITTGFRPRVVRVMNVTSRDQMEHFEGMTDATGLKTVAAGTRTLAGSNGITIHDDGFTVGLDADVNVVDEQISWEAIG